MPVLDLQHRQLIDMLNELHAAMSAARGQQVMGDLLLRLSNYARTHLETEERLLRAHDYPQFASHKAQHDAYVARMRDLQAQAQQGKVAMTVSVMSFLKEWWTRHILETDMEYSEFLKTRNAA